MFALIILMRSLSSNRKYGWTGRMRSARMRGIRKIPAPASCNMSPYMVYIRSFQHLHIHQMTTRSHTTICLHGTMQSFYRLYKRMRGLRYTARVQCTSFRSSMMYFLAFHLLIMWSRHGDDGRRNLTISIMVSFLTQ